MIGKERVAVLLILAGIIIIGMCQLLPLYREYSTMVLRGPHGELTRENYYIDRWITPIIEDGSPIEIEITLDDEAKLYLLVYPSDENGAQVGPRLISFASKEPRYYLIKLSSIQTSHYLFMISVFNGAYEMKVSSVWSRYEVLKPYTLMGILLLVSGLIWFYYLHIQRKTVESLK
jgi:hypothetical protein